MNTHPETDVSGWATNDHKLLFLRHEALSGIFTLVRKGLFFIFPRALIRFAQISKRLISASR